MSERRYSDDEVAAIFQRAVEGARSSPTQVVRSEGLTLAEVQQIGREAGIAPEAVALAARSLGQQPAAHVRRLLGLPIGVERTISLGRFLSDEEWEHLVVHLRKVFDARGQVSAHGNFRQWSNGNLSVYLEPTPTGHQLRLKTIKGSARAGLAASAAMLLVSTVLTVGYGAIGAVDAALPGILTFLLGGTGVLLATTVRLPGWARLRARQMEEIEAAIGSGEPELLSAASGDVRQMLLHDDPSP